MQLTEMFIVHEPATARSRGNGEGAPRKWPFGFTKPGFLAAFGGYFRHARIHTLERCKKSQGWSDTC